MLLSEYRTKKSNSLNPIPTPDPDPEPGNAVDAGEYDTLADAIADVPVGGTLSIPAGSSAVQEEVTFDKDITVKGNGVTFEKPVIVSDANVTLDGVKIVASGTDASDKTVALKVSGTKPFLLKDSEVSGTTRTALSIMTSGDIVIEDNVFDAGNKSIYNMIEFSISNARDISNVTFKNNTFKGELKNNGVSLYNLAEGAKVNFVGNTFTDIDVSNNPIRLSNPKNVSATFNFKDTTYNFTSDVPNVDGYTGFMLLQDYSKSGSKQDFTKFTINFDNLVRGTKKLTEKGSGIDNVYYVYQDTKGILADGINDPVVSFK